MAKNWEEAFREKFINPKDLEKKVKQIKQKGKIATLNGSFDLLHAGHLHIIYKASQIADYLIVAINSDSSIKNYKSKNRPIIPLKYRMQMVSSIGFVDFVTYFSETDPRKILEIIKPDFHVNGKEYEKNCIEQETVEKFGGKLFFVERVFSLSSSEIINRIKNEID